MAVTEGHAERFRTGDLPVEILQKDIVVAARLHFGERNALALVPQTANVNQLCIVLRIAGGQNIRQGAGGIQRSQAGDAELDTAAVEVDEVPDILRLCGAGQNDVIDLSLFQQTHDAAVTAQFADNLHFRAKAHDFAGGAVRGIKPETHVI